MTRVRGNGYLFIAWLSSTFLPGVIVGLIALNPGIAFFITMFGIAFSCPVFILILIYYNIRFEYVHKTLKRHIISIPIILGFLTFALFYFAGPDGSYINAGHHGLPIGKALLVIVFAASASLIFFALCRRASRKLNAP